MSSVSAEQTATNATVPETARRMSSDERREQIIAAAMAVFGARGYEGTTTDDVARTAGVSQPYVVRLFRSKENLFLEAMQSALDEMMHAYDVFASPDQTGALKVVLDRTADRTGAQS